MNKLKVLTFMHFKQDYWAFRKVKTVDNIPKILTIISGSNNGSKKAKRRSSLFKKYQSMNSIAEDAEDADESS